MVEEMVSGVRGINPIATIIAKQEFKPGTPCSPDLYATYCGTMAWLLCCRKTVNKYMLECMLNPFPNKLWFLHVCSTSLLKKILGKGEIAHNEQFLLFPQCFLPI